MAGGLMVAVGLPLVPRVVVRSGAPKAYTGLLWIGLGAALVGTVIYLWPARLRRPASRWWMPSIRPCSAACPAPGPA